MAFWLATTLKGGYGERLHEAEAELTVLLANGVAVNLDVFGGARNVVQTGANPMADDAGAEHVANQFVTRSIPNKQSRAGTAAAV
jgi:hypothetical protein